MPHQHHQHEDQAGEIEGGHQRAQLNQGVDTVLADREAHRSEGAQGREANHHMDDAEEQLGQGFQAIGHLVAEIAHPGAGKARQHRDEQHLQQVALGERAEEGVGDQVQQIGDQPLALMGLGQVAGGDLGIQRRRVDVEAASGLHHLADDQADDQGHRRDDLEIDQGLQPHPPERLDVAHPRDAAGHGAEDHRRDDQLDQLDEGVAQRLQPHPDRRPQSADQYAQRDGDQDLHIKRLQTSKQTHGFPRFRTGFASPPSCAIDPCPRGARPGSSAG